MLLNGPSIVGILSARTICFTTILTLFVTMVTRMIIICTTTIIIVVISVVIINVGEPAASPNQYAQGIYSPSGRLQGLGFRVSV